MAFQSKDLLEAMRADARLPLAMLKVDGGASINNSLMQFQADILNATVRRPIVAETTALGAAYLAGMGAGFWKTRSEIENSWQMDRMFQPAMRPEEVARRRGRWAEALQRSRDWEKG